MCRIFTMYQTIKVMTNESQKLQTTLNALEAQLLTKKQALIDYETSVFEIQMKDLTERASKWLKENVDVHNKIEFTTHSLKVKCSDTYGSDIEVYYRRSYEENVANKSELNWFGSSCDIEDSIKLGYLITLGKIAGSLREIQEQQHEWYAEAKNYKRSLNEYYSDISSIESAINDTKKSIRNLDIERYTAVGFKCEFKPFLRIERDYSNNGEYCIKECAKTINFRYGYGKWDSFEVYSFEVVEKLKRGKFLVRCKVFSLENERILDKEVTSKFLEDFIKEAYDWQTSGAEATNARETKKFENYTI